MVNTRRKSQVLSIDPLAAELSDSSTTSTTRRSTRRSLGTVLATPVEIPTPTRRSRRLSNSSVESANNDTPRPGTRRSSRINKITGSDNETSDVELVVIKRRKLGESVDTLIPIREEKNEERSNTNEKKETHVLVELEEEVEDEIVCKNSDAEVNDERNETEVIAVLPNKEIKEVIMQQLLVKKSKEEDIEEKDTDILEIKAEENIKVDEVDNNSLKSEHAIEIVEAYKENSSEENHQEKFFTPVSTPTNLSETEDAIKQTEDAIKVTRDESKQIEDESKQIEDGSKQNEDGSKQNEDGSKQIEDESKQIEDESKQAENMDCTPIEEQQSLTIADNSKITSPKSCDQQQQEESKSSVSPLKETNVIANSPVKSDVEKPRMLFGVPANMITVNKTLIIVKKKGKKEFLEKRRLRMEKKTREKKVEPIKESLPCGADIMRNIPRGKSKSGREWKEPKSNPRYLYQDKGLKMPFEKITQLRQERQRVKELENRMKEEEKARRAEITRRREVNKKREEENARRGEVVQVIRNTNKIKRMKKKQLKLIQKRDTTKVV